MLYWTVGENEQKMVVWRDWVMWRRAESKLLWGLPASSEVWGRQDGHYLWGVWMVQPLNSTFGTTNWFIWRFGGTRKGILEVFFFVLLEKWSVKERSSIGLVSAWHHWMVYTWSDQNLISDLSALSKHPCGYSVQVALYLTGLGQWLGEQ